MRLREILKKNDLELYGRLERIQDYFERSFRDFLGVTYISGEDKTVYTGHGIAHSQAIERILDRLIPIEIKEQLEPYEIFILLSGVILHDIGMKYEYYENEDIESIRQTHNYRSQEFIKEKYQEIGLAKEERIPVGLLAYAHRGEGTIDELKYNFPCCGETIRLKFLACLLRLGDELDVSHDRAPTILRELVKFTGTSEEHWDLLKKLYTPVIDSKDWTITIKAEIDNPLEEHQILVLINKIQKELDQIKDILKVEGLDYDKITHFLDEKYEGGPELSEEEIKKRIKIPFPLFNSYGYNEWSYLFFGREDEISDLTGLVLSNRVTFLTGESAVGKTSLLQAGLMPKLIANSKNPQKIVIYVRCGKDPIQSVRDKIVKDFPEYKKLADDISIEKFLREFGKGKEKVIIIDQFEEIFTIVPAEKRKMSLDALRRLLNDEEFRIKLLLSFREEFEAKLAGELPSLLRNRYKLERLTLKKTKEVITKTCKYWGIKIEKNLVNKIIEDVEEYGMCFPPDIQIVCYSLLDALDKDELLITEKLYKTLGGAENIIKNYFEKLLDEFQPDEKDTVIEILKKMITDSNTKNVLTLNEIASKVEREIDVEKTIKKLVEKKIVRYLPEENKYELIHDVLVKKIEEMLTEEEKEMKIAKYTLGFAVSSWKQDGSLISIDHLNSIYKFVNRLNLTDEEVELIMRSSLEHISDPHWDVRKNVVDTFGIIKDKRCVEPLVKLLNKEVVHDVKQAIVITLGEIGDEKAVDALINRLNDEYMYVRVDAIKALGKIGDKRAVEPLINKLGEFEYWNVKKEAAIGLGHIGDTSATPILIERLNDVKEDRDVQKAVISALRMLGEDVSPVKYNKSAQIQKTEQTKELTLRLPIIPVTGYTLYYVAKDKGYYDEAGLDVSIQYGERGAMESIEKLDEIKAYFGQSTGDSVILAREKRHPVISVYQIAQNNTFCIISKSEKNITRLEDLVGKKIALTGLDAPTYTACKVILHKVGVDYSKVHFIESGKNFLKNLEDDKVDAGGYHLAQKVLLDRKGIGIRVNYVSDWANLVPECIVVDERMIKKNPELIKKFISATDKGLRYAIEHPDEAIDSFMRFNPDKSKERDFYLDSWKQFVCEAVLNDIVKKRGLGWSNKKQWVETQAVLSEMGAINTETNVSKMFTNQFIT